MKRQKDRCRTTICNTGSASLLSELTMVLHSPKYHSAIKHALISNSADKASLLLQKRDKYSLSLLLGGCFNIAAFVHTKIQGKNCLLFEDFPSSHLTLKQY